MYNSVKVAAISIKPKKWDKAANADKMEAFFVEAAKEQPQVILTTEGVLEGYVVMEAIENQETAERLIDIAEPTDGPYIRRFQQLAKQLGTCLCFGFAERIADEVYNCAVFIDHNGDICGKYHKTQLAEGAHSSWSFNRIGKTLRAFDTPIGRAGAVICNDRWNPMITRTLVLDGARLIFIPSYGSKSKGQNEAVLARATGKWGPNRRSECRYEPHHQQGRNCHLQVGERPNLNGGYRHPRTSIATDGALRRTYLQQQGPEMEKRYQKTMERLTQ